MFFKNIEDWDENETSLMTANEAIESKESESNPGFDNFLPRGKNSFHMISLPKSMI